MTQSDDRSLEAKLAQDEETLFRILARRNRLLGEWAAELMGLSEAETQAYAAETWFALTSKVVAARMSC